MPKDVSYHEAAIRYNEEIAQFAEDLAPTLADEEVQRWSRAVAKQHRFHAGRHKKARSKLQSQEQEDNTPDPNPGPIVDDIDPVGTDLGMIDVDAEMSIEVGAEEKYDTSSVMDEQRRFAESSEHEEANNA